ncbi:MAG: DUF3095 domain-containing protein [Patescibacteria group bacterium]
MSDSKIDTSNFYHDLPSLRDFGDVANPGNYVPVPEDWWVVITDVRGSTKAIEAGLYKEVNLVGASSIAALLHVAGNLDIPFVFGGDGATFVLPPSMMNESRRALADAQLKAKEGFGMDLRVGIIAVSEIVAAGHPILVSKFHISKEYHQAMFRGGGLSYAEKLVKGLETEKRYALSMPSVQGEADLHGLSCRWRDVESRYGETISLIIKAKSEEGADAALYRDIIAQVETLFGPIEMHHPVALEKLALPFSTAVVEREASVLASHSSTLSKWLFRVQFGLLFLGAVLLERSGISEPFYDFPQYKRRIISSSDYKKFDDLLRMVIAGTPEKRKALATYLEELRGEGKIFYGMHVSNRAVMTCLVFEHRGRQVHFIDGADGGYTMASKQLKAQMAEER